MPLVWKLLFNVDKCKVKHFGYNNTLARYYIDNIVLPTCTVERELGDTEYQVSDQGSKTAYTADIYLGMINRTFSHESGLLVYTVYISLVRPHLDYCTQAWRPFLKKDVNTIKIKIY